MKSPNCVMKICAPGLVIFTAKYSSSSGERMASRTSSPNRRRHSVRFMSVSDLLVELVDKALFDDGIDDRVVEKFAYRCVFFTFPIEHRLDHRRLNPGIAIEILDGVIIGLIERITAAQKVFTEHFIGKVFSAS